MLKPISPDGIVARRQMLYSLDDADTRKLFVWVDNARGEVRQRNMEI